MKSSKNKPLVSVVVPTKNNARTIRKCLQSIKDQTYKNIEIIVVDNYSVDDTQKISKTFANKIYVKGPERNIQREIGSKSAKGEYIAFIDSDMYLSKRVIEECVNLSISDDSIVSIYIPEKSIGRGFWARCKQLERSFYVDISWMNATRFFKKSIYDKVGGYDKEMISGEDWDLSQRISVFGKSSKTKSFILHDEGKISLLKTIQKKFYYATKFSKYIEKNKHVNNTNYQTNPLLRYWIFFRHPIILFKNPVLGFGMLFMKTCEFVAGGLGVLVNNND